MKKVISLIIIIFILLNFFACSKKDNASNGYVKKKVVISYGATYTQIVNQTIMLKDLLSPLLPDDVSVEWSNLVNTQDIRDAATAGKMDIFTLSASGAISAIENGLPFHIISNQVAGYAKILTTKDYIVNISDLTSDSKVTVSSKGSTPHLIFSLYCLDVLHNATIYDNALVPVPDADAIGLIQTSHDYDAYILSFPACYKIPDYVNYHVVDDITPTSLKYNVGTYILTTEEFEENNPVIIEAFKKASAQAVDLLNNDTYEIAVLLSDFYDVQPELLAETIHQCPPKLEISGYDDIANLMLEMGILTKPAKKFSELSNYKEIPK